MIQFLEYFTLQPRLILSSKTTMAQNEAEALQKMGDLEERIKAPSIWGRVPCGIRFEDLQDRRYDDAVRLLKKHYLPEEVSFYF